MFSYRKWRRRVGRLLAVAATICIALTLAPAAANANLPVYYVPLDGFVHEVGHHCLVIGSDGSGNQAVHCAEIMAQVDPVYGVVYIWGQNEVYCQNSSGVVECKGIQETPDICEGSNSICDSGPAGICGALFGHSACGKRRVINATSFYWQQGSAFAFEYWAASINDLVVLPTGKTVGGTGTNVASLHYIIAY
jgi:hypothetical protein